MIAATYMHAGAQSALIAAARAQRSQHVSRVRRTLQMVSRPAAEASTRLEYWPTSEGVHVVAIDSDRAIRQVGVLWVKAA